MRACRRCAEPLALSAHPNRVFCSKLCKDRANREANPRVKVARFPKTCDHCGRHFHATEARARFCDLTCFGASRARPVHERFWEKVAKAPGCWEWTGARIGGRKPHHGRYGVLRVGEARMAAHRLSFQIAYGPIPADLHVLHRCDNPPCVNPEHLFLGTHADNMADKAARGRAPRTAGSFKAAA